MPRLLASLALVAALALAPAAQGTVLASWSVEEVVRRADSVVIGTVGQKQTIQDEKGQLLTETTVEVEEVLKGAAHPRLTVTQLGGERGGVVTEVAGDARLEPGARVLLMTFAHRDGRRYLVGMALGAYRLGDDSVPVQRIDVSLIDDEGRLLPAPGERRVSLERVRALASSTTVGPR